MEGKPIYFNNVTVCEVTKRGKTVTEKELFSMETPTTSTTIKEFMDSDADLSFVASRYVGKSGLRTTEKVKLFRENFRVTRIDVGKIIGYQSIDRIINADEYL